MARSPPKEMLGHVKMVQGDYRSGYRETTGVGTGRL